MAPRSKRWWLAAAALCWSAATLAGFHSLWAYMYTPAADAVAPVRFPAGAGLMLDAGVPTLIAFAHPQCPCTAATLTELDALRRSTAGRVHTVVLFYRPREAAPGWEQTELWQRAAAWPDVELRTDPDGETARRLGVKASGQVLLYGMDGRLRFSGGITGARGHAGDNAGRRALRAAVEHADAPLSRSSVFGCLIVRDVEGGFPVESAS